MKRTILRLTSLEAREVPAAPIGLSPSDHFTAGPGVGFSVLPAWAFVDPDGDALTLRSAEIAPGAPSGATAEISGGMLRVSSFNPGEIFIQLVARDSHGEEGTTVGRLVVNPVFGGPGNPCPPPIVPPPPTVPPPSAPQQSVFTILGNGSVLRSGLAFQAFTDFPQFSVRLGDVTGDHVADLVAGAGFGGGPLVKVFDGVTGNLTIGYFAYSIDFRGGVNITLADTDGTGVYKIVTGAGFLGGPHVQVWEVHGLTVVSVRSFFAYEAAYRNGVEVEAADFDNDGRDDIVTAPGLLGGPRVRIFWAGDPNKTLADFFAASSEGRDGVTIFIRFVDGEPELVTQVPGQPSTFRGWKAADLGITRIDFETIVVEPGIPVAIYVG